MSTPMIRAAPRSLAPSATYKKTNSCGKCNFFFITAVILFIYFTDREPDSAKAENRNGGARGNVGCVPYSPNS